MKPRRPLISDSLTSAARIPVLVFTQIAKQPVAVIPPADDDVDEFFDASENFSNDDFDEEQAPDDDISQMVIKFHPLSVWNNSEDNKVEYILPPNFGELYYEKLHNRNSDSSFPIS